MTRITHKQIERAVARYNAARGLYVGILTEPKRRISPDAPSAHGAAWARSTRRAGTMYHAHVLGSTACGSIRLDRHDSIEADSLFAMQYFGVCPRCYRLATR